MCLGDGVAQLVIEKKESMDWARNARFGALGLFFVVSLPIVNITCHIRGDFCPLSGANFAHMVQVFGCKNCRKLWPCSIEKSGH